MLLKRIFNDSLCSKPLPPSLVILWCKVLFFKTWISVVFSTVFLKKIENHKFSIFFWFSVPKMSHFMPQNVQGTICNGIMRRLSVVSYWHQSSSEPLWINPLMYRNKNIKLSLWFERNNSFYFILDNPISMYNFFIRFFIPTVKFFWCLFSGSPSLYMKSTFSSSTDMLLSISNWQSFGQLLYLYTTVGFLCLCSQVQTSQPALILLQTHLL